MSIFRTVTGIEVQIKIGVLESGSYFIFMSLIQTQRLNLKLLHLDDAEDVYRYASDPAVAEHTAWWPHKSLEDAIAFVESVLAKNSHAIGRLHHVWAIRRVDEKQVIGTVSLVQDSERVAHVDYALSRHYWSKGYMTEAVSAVIRWAFKNITLLDQIDSGCLTRNTGSVQVLKKVGFEIVERYESKRGPKFDNEVLETSLFRLLRENWE